METRSTNSFPASSSRRLPTVLLPTCVNFSSNLKLRSPCGRKNRERTDSSMSSSAEFDGHLRRSNYFQAPNSPGQTVKRLVKSVSKNALKLASALSPRSRSSSPPLISLSKSSFQEEEEAREAMVAELSAVFRYFDADGDGKISWAEVKSALNSVGEEVGENELREMMKELDSDGDGCIDLSEFIGLINTEERGAEEAEKELVAAFRMFEREGQASGGITPLGLHRMMSRLGVVGEGENPLTLQRCSFIISQVDLDGDGVVNYQEFKRMMTATAH